MNNSKIKEIDRAVYNSANADDVYQSSASAGAMFEIEKRWFESILAKLGNDHKLGIGLEIGCGGGFNLTWLCQQCGFTVGLDHSITNITDAKSRYNKNANVAIIIADAENVPLKENSLNIAFCGSLLHHLPEYETSLLETNMCLQENGVLIASEPCAYNPFAVIRRKFFASIYHTPNERPFPPNEIIEAFRRNFDFVYYKRQFLFSINSSIIEQFLGKKSAAIYLKIAMVFDGILLKIPVIKELCWRIDLIGVKLPKLNIFKK